MPFPLHATSQGAWECHLPCGSRLVEESEWGRVLAVPLSLSSTHNTWPHASLDPQWSALSPAPHQPPWLQLSTLVLLEEHHVSPSNSATQNQTLLSLGFLLSSHHFQLTLYEPSKKTYSQPFRWWVLLLISTPSFGYTSISKEYMSLASLSIWAPLLLQILTQTHLLWEQLVKFSSLACRKNIDAKVRKNWVLILMWPTTSCLRGESPFLAFLKT